MRERDQLADPFTKYIKYDAWFRHFHIILNRQGDPPNPVSMEESKLSKTDNTAKVYVSFVTDGQAAAGDEV